MREENGVSGRFSSTWLTISGGDEGGVAMEPSAGLDGVAAIAVRSLAAATLILRGSGMRMPRYIREGGMIGVEFLDTPNKYRGLKRADEGWKISSRLPFWITKS
jgi:hypothetical protein